MEYFVKHYNDWPWGESVIIITNDGIGTATVTCMKDDPDVALISDMSVHHSTRKLGIGNLLLNECEHEIKKKGLKKAKLMAEYKSMPYDWYKRHGYEETGEMQMFPQSMESMFVTMEKTL